MNHIRRPWSKLTISNIQYQFNAKSSLNHFKFKVNDHCKMNQNEDGASLKLILNGKIIVDDAFKLLQTKLHLVHELHQSPKEQLPSIRDVLMEKYGKANLVIYYKQTLQKIKQNNKSIKECLDYFKSIKR